MSFITANGTYVPAITADDMRRVDEIAVEEFGLGILQMMENAGRNLAGNVIEMIERSGDVVILAGGGGNGGGGLSCARHLHNRRYPVRIVLDRPPERLSAAARTQLRTLITAGVPIVTSDEARGAIEHASIIVDALIGYGLTTAPRGDTATLIRFCTQSPVPVISLDIPSGRDATTGKSPGDVIVPVRTMTLALPKTGLIDGPGELVLADIGIPPAVYDRIGVTVDEYFGSAYWVPLEPARQSRG